MVLCNAPLRSFVGLLWVLRGPLRSFVGPLRSFVVLCGPLRSFAVFSHTRFDCSPHSRFTFNCVFVVVYTLFDVNENKIINILGCSFEVEEVESSNLEIFL